MECGSEWSFSITGGMGEEGCIFQPIVVGTEVEEDFDRFAFRGISSCAETRLENCVLKIWRS